MPQWLVDLFSRYGYAVVFVGVFLENMGVPVPGETVLLAGAALAHAGHLTVPGVITTGVAGAVLGDNLGFWIGRRGGRRLAERWGPSVGLTRARLTQFDRFFARHGAKTVFAARFITGLRVFGAVLAGGSELPWTTFLAYNASGAVTWVCAVTAAGYFLALSWSTLERWIGRFGVAGLVVCVVLVLFAVLRNRESEA